MLVPSPRINALYLSSVEECARAGVQLSAADYALLWECSRRAVDTGGDLPAFLAPSVEIRPNLVLQRPGVGLLDWLSAILQPAMEGESDCNWVIAVAWALAHARDRLYFEAHSTPARIRRAVLRFARCLPWDVTPEELAWGVTVALGGERKRVGKGRVEASGLDWGEYIARLANDYKLDPRDLAWGMTRADVEKLAAARPGISKSRASRGWHELRAVVVDLKARARQEKETPNG